jgi:hypothetical protein
MGQRIGMKKMGGIEKRRGLIAEFQHIKEDEIAMEDVRAMREFPSDANGLSGIDLTRETAFAACRESSRHSAAY